MVKRRVFAIEKFTIGSRNIGKWRPLSLETLPLGCERSKKPSTDYRYLFSWCLPRKLEGSLGPDADRNMPFSFACSRRAHLKECFDSLKAEVPCQRDRKITNLQVLNLAIKYIQVEERERETILFNHGSSSLQTLARKERDYDQEIAQLTSRHAELQQRLGCLKNELNTEGHDVDTWLDSCSDIDHSVSTQTASEAEMYRSFDDEHDELEPSPHASTKKLADLQDPPTHQASNTSCK